MVCKKCGTVKQIKMNADELNKMGPHGNIFNPNPPMGFGTMIQSG